MVDQERHNELIQDAAVARAALAEAQSVSDLAEAHLADARTRAMDAWKALSEFMESTVAAQTSTIAAAVAEASVSRIH